METIKSSSVTGRIRPARMSDVRAIQKLLMVFASRDLMLPKSISALYDYLRDFVVYEEAGEIQGICSLHICWDDLAEIRVSGDGKKQGERIGSVLS